MPSFPPFESPQSRRSRHQDAGDEGAKHPPPSHPILLQRPCGEQHSVWLPPIPSEATSQATSATCNPGRDTQMSSWGPTGAFLLQVSTQALPQHAGQHHLQKKSLLTGWYSSSSACRLVGSRQARWPSRGPSTEGGTHGRRA